MWYIKQGIHSRRIAGMAQDALGWRISNRRIGSQAPGRRAPGRKLERAQSRAECWGKLEADNVELT